MAENVLDVGEWKSISSKSDEGIPPLGDNTYSCTCSPCKAVLKETAHWTGVKKGECPHIPIMLGDRVLVNGSHPGIVRYVGDLDSKYTDDQIYVGVKLDDPVGEHDGVYYNKRFFNCPDMHGVIVPIEQVHVLTPRDGREIKVNTRYFSMPEMADLGSLSNIASGPCNCKTISQTLSEGQLSTGTTAKRTSLDSVELVEDLEVDINDKIKTSLNDEGINRSAVFICDKPGSIAASIANTKSGSDIKDMLLKKLSSGGSVSSRDETTTNGKEESTTKNIAKKESGKRAVKCASNRRVRPRSASQKRCVSAMSMRSSQSSKRSVASSRSANSSLSIRKSEALSASKLMTANQPTKEESTGKPTQGPVEAAIQTTQADHEAESVTVEPEPPTKPAVITNKDTTNTALAVALAKPSLQLTEKLNERNSFTWHLLSCLPPSEAQAPLMPDCRMDDAKEFGELMKQFGDNYKAWVLSHTIEKLKDAQQRGKAEVEWQQNVDKLEESGQFAERFSVIKSLREEVSMYRKMTDELEDQCKSLTTCESSDHEGLKNVENQIKTIDEEIASLVGEVREHDVFDALCDALSLFGCEWKDVEDDASTCTETSE